MCQLITATLRSAGLKDLEVFSGRGKGVLPGYYRPTKDWDVVAVADDKDGRRCLIAAVEVKSHAGPSFGNNFNNRVEEAFGNSTDFWAAYEKSILPAYPAPFPGYIMLFEEMRQSTTSVKTSQPYFAVDAILRDASYRDRYQVLCDRLMRERRYSATAFITATKDGGSRGVYAEPLQSAAFYAFALALYGAEFAFAAARQA